MKPGRSDNCWWDEIVKGEEQDDEWTENFCMSRASVFSLTEEPRQHIEGKTTNMRAPIDPLRKVALTLFYLSNEGRLMKTSKAFGVSRQTVSVTIRQTCRAITIHMGPKYITLPFTNEDATPLVEGFHQAHGLPQCLGAIDGHHIEIKQPSAHSIDYVNKKGRYTLNVQAVCDFKYRFRDVMIKWSGKAHDAVMFDSSAVNEFMKSGKVPHLRRQLVEDEFPIPIFLVGDAAYPLMPHLMPEPSDNGSTPEEENFSRSVSRARTVIDFAFGRLKARFAALRRPMDINLDDLPFVIYSCFVLHNYCEAREEFVDEQAVMKAMEVEKESQPPTQVNRFLPESDSEDLEGDRVRRVLMKYLGKKDTVGLDS